MENRIGYVNISEGLIDSEPDFIEKYLGDCEVLDIRPYEEVFGRKKYMLRCPEFDELNIGDLIPTYIFNFEYAQDGSVIRLPVERI